LDYVEVVKTHHVVSILHLIFHTTVFIGQIKGLQR